MNLAAIKAASRPELVECTVAAARNAQDLVDDADLLSKSGRNGRAYSIAVLGVEESAKAMSLAVLAGIPDSIRHQAPLRRLLEWHQLKLVGGLLLTVLPFGSIASMLTVMTPAELEQAVAALEPANKSDRLKLRGMYADMGADGRTRAPTEITATEVDEQLAQARKAAASAGAVILGPRLEEVLTDADGLELAGDLLIVLSEAGSARTPTAATAVILQAIGRFRSRRGP